MSEVNNDNPTFELHLELEAINQMLGLLSEHPYKQSAGIINLIMRQVQPQVEKLQAERAAAEGQPEASAE